MTQASRAAVFSELHQRPELFLIPNAWDAGSAKLLDSLGFSAIATTSAGLAFTVGRKDGQMSREAKLGLIFLEVKRVAAELARIV